MKNLRRVVTATAAALVVAVALSSCAMLESFGEKFNRALSGVSATMTTYNQNGQKIDDVHGTSFQVSRDTRFDTTYSEGGSNSDSNVLLISLGKSHISHVGSSLIMAQDGLTDVTAGIGNKIKLENNEAGTPWLNDIFEMNRNLWQGKGKTILVRSQNGNPIAVYAGNEVEILPTDVPKSTWFRVDGKYLLVYRSDYTVYDNDLLAK